MKECKPTKNVKTTEEQPQLMVLCGAATKLELKYTVLHSNCSSILLPRQ